MSEFFRKLFGKKDAIEIAETDTVPVEPESTQNEPSEIPEASNETAPLSVENLTEISQRISPPQLIAGCGHSVGKQRDHNEDALFTNTIKECIHSCIIF